MGTIDPLKEELSSSITCCRKLEARVSECQREVDVEKETQRIQQRQHVDKVIHLPISSTFRTKFFL